MITPMAPAPVASQVMVGSPSSAPPIAKGFLGFSIEYQSVAVDAGPASNPDPLLPRLVDALNPGQQPVIRIGGDSSDHSWFPIPGVSNPGLKFALTPSWLSSVAAFARTAKAKLLLGINLEINDPNLAAAEATKLEAGLGASHILAWEVGNEPDLYPYFPYYVTTPNDPDDGVYARPTSYSFSQYLAQYNATARRLPHLPLAGPAFGTTAWLSDLPALLSAEPRLTQVTYHAYPTNCRAAKGTPGYPSIDDLLSPAASVGLAAAAGPSVRAARSAGRSFRVDELNSSSCGGAPGVSNTFASALWVTEALFAMASQGVSGVNIQDFNSSAYKPFGFSQTGGTWTATVEPLYYGLLLFARAAPAGSRLLSVSTAGSGDISAWAARTPAGAETVTLINDSTTRSDTVAVSAPGTRSGTSSRLLAPSAAAQSGVSIGGQSYGNSTTTGQLTGTSSSQTLAPSSGGTYTVTLAPASAVLLSLTR